MLPRKYRRMPKSFDDFEKIFGWKLAKTSPFVAELGLATPETQARASLKLLARDYLSWFERAPAATHLFPLTGAIFQYWFARGVRDAAGSKTRLRTMATWRGRERKALRIQAGKLKLKGNRIVVHDHVKKGGTSRKIAELAGVPQEKLDIHRLTLDQVAVCMFAPLPGVNAKTHIYGRTIVGKKTARGKLDLSPKEKTLSKRQVAFIKRAVYAAGVAAARELLAEEKK